MSFSFHYTYHASGKNSLNMLPNNAIFGMCVQLSKVMILKGMTQIQMSGHFVMFVFRNPPLYSHASILAIFVTISHGMHPMRDMILKIREINR